MCLSPPALAVPSRHSSRYHLSITTAQKVFTRAKARAAVTKVGGIHSLHHAYATHRLDHGLAVHELRRLLCHGNLQSTQRYVHWLPGSRGSGQAPADLLADPGVRHE